MANQLKDLQIIPSVGKNIASDFSDVGIKKVSDLKGKDPKKLKWWDWKDK